MKQPFSPLIDFYPADFGLDLNGKRFTWQAVILLPFIDEPRLVRILAPLLKRLSANEKVRNRRGCELVFGHKDDKKLFHLVQLAQAAFESGNAGPKTQIRGDRHLFGTIEGWQTGGANRQVVSPIEGLPDVEESHAISALFQDPDSVPHVSKMLPGITEQAVVINAQDMDEQSRMKGFGGEPAKRMIMQALGKDPERKPRYKDIKPGQMNAKPEASKQQPAAARQWREPWREKNPVHQMNAPPVAKKEEDVGMVMEYEEDESEFADSVKVKPQAPPAGAKVIRVHASGKVPAKTEQKASSSSFQPVRKTGTAAKVQPY